MLVPIRYALLRMRLHAPHTVLVAFGIAVGAAVLAMTAVGSSAVQDRAVQRALARFHATAENDERIGALQARLAKLTPREREVFELVVRGKLNKQIAHQLGTSERTIKAHRHNIMHKLQMQSLAALVVFAERVGLLEERR